MRKIVSAALTALLFMTMLITPVCAEGGMFGLWYLNEYVIEGYTISAHSMGRNMTVDINGDETARIEIRDEWEDEPEVLDGKWTYKDSVFTIEMNQPYEDPLIMTYDREQETMTANYLENEIGGTMIFRKEEPQPIEMPIFRRAEGEKAFTGEWTLLNFGMKDIGGYIMYPAGLLGEVYTITIKNGKLVFDNNGEKKEYNATYEDGTIVYGTSEGDIGNVLTTDDGWIVLSGVVADLPTDIHLYFEKAK